MEIPAEFRDFFGAFVTRSCKNVLVLSFTYVSAFNNLKSEKMITAHLAELHFVKFERHNRFLLKSGKIKGHLLRKSAHVFALISSGHG